MSEELMLYSYSASPLAVQKKPHTGDYEISVFGGAPATLRRGLRHDSPEGRQCADQAPNAL